MAEKKYKVYGYRWVILIVFMLVNIAIQILWISFASIGGPAAEYYGVTDLNIGFLSMIFMIVYVPLSLPISWLIDKLGYKKAVGLGALIMTVFALLRGLFADDYSAVVWTTVGIAASQPFFLNAFTTVAAKWFSIDERAIASGLATVAMFVGIAIGMVVTPMIILNSDIQTAQISYGIVALVTSIIFWIFTKEAPPTPPCPPEQEERALMIDGLKKMLKMKDVWYLMSVFLVGMGIFNGISTWIENIGSTKGFTTLEAGELGAFFLLGGILGAIIIPAFSDKYRKRKPFLLAGMVFAIPGLIGVTFASSYGIMVVSLMVLGFFMVGLAPVGYQYGAEITHPSPEGTSNGLMVLAGQVSVVFVYAMDYLKGDDGSFTVSLLMFTGLMVLSAFMISKLSESTLIDA